MNKNIFLNFAIIFLGGITLIITALFLPSYLNKFLTATIYTPPQCPFHVGLTPNQITTDSELSLKQEAILLKLFFNQVVVDNRGIAICKETDSLNTCLARFQNLCYQKGKCTTRYDSSKDATLTPEIQSYLCSLWNQLSTKLFTSTSWTKVTSLFSQLNTPVPNWLINSRISYLAVKNQLTTTTTITTIPTNSSTAEWTDYYMMRPFIRLCGAGEHSFLEFCPLHCLYSSTAYFKEFDKECQEFVNRHNLSWLTQYGEYWDDYVCKPTPEENLQKLQSDPRYITNPEEIPHRPKIRVTLTLKALKDDKPKIEFITKLGKNGEVISSQVIFSDKEVKAGQEIPLSFIWTEPLGAKGIDEIVKRYVGKKWQEVKDDPAICFLDYYPIWYYIQDENDRKYIIETEEVKNLRQSLNTLYGCNAKSKENAYIIATAWDSFITVDNILYSFVFKITTASGKQLIIQPPIPFPKECENVSKFSPDKDYCFPRSTTSSSKPWIKVLSFRPLDTGSYIRSGYEQMYAFCGSALRKQVEMIKTKVVEEKSIIEEKKIMKNRDPDCPPGSEGKTCWVRKENRKKEIVYIDDTSEVLDENSYTLKYTCDEYSTTCPGFCKVGHKFLIKNGETEGKEVKYIYNAPYETGKCNAEGQCVPIEKDSVKSKFKDIFNTLKDGIINFWKQNP